MGVLMKKLRTQLLATAAVMTLSGAAYAADMGVPMKAPPPAPIPYTNWQGFYIGGLLGVGRSNQQVNSYGGTTTTKTGSICGSYGAQSCTNDSTAFIGGVEVGYDWQSRYFVYGVAADWTWAGFKRDRTNASGASIWTHQSKIQWLASFRGRMGLAVDDTLVYFTGGLALGQVKVSGQFADSSAVEAGPLNINKTQVGWVAGLGVEHKFNQNWSLKAEYLYYDLGKTSGNWQINAGGSDPGTTYTTDVNTQIHVGRVGLVYRW
jgi:outer membrane immunogenic protein